MSPDGVGSDKIGLWGMNMLLRYTMYKNIESRCNAWDLWLQHLGDRGMYHCESKPIWATERLSKQQHPRKLSSIQPLLVAISSSRLDFHFFSPISCQHWFSKPWGPWQLFSMAVTAGGSLLGWSQENWILHSTPSPLPHGVLDRLFGLQLLLYETSKPSFFEERPSSSDSMWLGCSCAQRY